jgi:hypothetical protein
VSRADQRPAILASSGKSLYVVALLFAMSGIPVAQTANVRLTASVLSKGQSAHNVSSQSEFVVGTNASEYSLRIMAKWRRFCNPPHRSLFALRMLDHLLRVGRSMTRYHYLGTSRALVLLQRPVLNSSCLLPRTFPSAMHFASNYSTSLSTATCPIARRCRNDQ